MSNASEELTGSVFKYDYMNGFDSQTTTNTNDVSYMFRRAPEFFDIVAYDGTGTDPTSFDHSLTIAPELMIFKRRDVAGSWHVFQIDAMTMDYRITLDLDLGKTSTGWGTSTYNPTATQFKLTNWTDVNGSSGEFVAYLFATLAGVSKVGSYTADATLTTIDCAFTASARFVMIKRTDAVGEWYIFDTARGIVAGNDPYYINTASAETTGTDYIDPDNSGFQITATGSGTINIDGASYIFLAIA